MDSGKWKLKKISEILDVPNLSIEYLPPQVIIELKEQSRSITSLGALILYGSVVRGEASPKSDIDLLAIPMDINNNDSLNDALKRILFKIEKEFNMKISFSLSVFTGDEDSYYIWEAAKDGIVLFSRPELIIHTMKNIKPYIM